MSHSFAGVRGLKFLHCPLSRTLTSPVALLRGGAWIEIPEAVLAGKIKVVALLRGGAWIEILLRRSVAPWPRVALLRGGAWIEIASESKR